MNQLQEVFSAHDGGYHNLHLLKKPVWARAMFLTTNIGYLIVALHLLFSSSSIKPAPSPIAPHGFCSSTAWFNPLMIGSLSLISFAFHFHQCFRCSTSSGRATCVKANKIDLTCAKVFAVYLCLCFYKRKMALFLPSVVLLVSSGILKLQGYYYVYMVLHGGWHLLSAYTMSVVICA